ncbi:hypothetical protein JCM8097_009146 [Rhodosporidiobolus ruineniae]
MKAVYVSKEGRDLKDYPVPSPQPGEILVKNIAVSSNPKDFKIPLYMAPYAAVEGNDIAGHVEQVGEGVTKFKKGDKVAAFTKMRTDDRFGAYAEYTCSPSNTAFHLGPKTSFEEAAAFPLAYITAAIGLFKRLSLPTPDAPAKDDHPAVLVWGGATTVGVYAIQLLKKANLHVVAVAGSSQSVPLSYGADAVIDYRGKSDAELISSITSAANGRIRYAFDAVSENGTLEILAEALHQLGEAGKEPTKVSYVLTASKEQEQLYAAKQVGFERCLCATAYGEDSDFAEHWFDRLGEWVEEGSFRSQKVTVIPGGLEGVKEGLRRLQQGEVRGEKLVYRIAETPGLA